MIKKYFFHFSIILKYHLSLFITMSDVLYLDLFSIPPEIIKKTIDKLPNYIFKTVANKFRIECKLVLLGMKVCTNYCLN